jgi:hypothetical protein
MIAVVCVLPTVGAQAQQTIARMSLAEGKTADAKVTGAVDIQDGEMRLASGAALAVRQRPAKLRLESGGELKVCANSAVHLASGANAGELMLSLDSGALELKSTLGQLSDVVITPDLRVLLSGPGTADFKMHVNQQGDTCIDNGLAGGPNADAPYVTVTEQFGTGVYRVQSGQRVMLEHGSVSAVVDQEKEPCGCPPDAAGPTDFPLAQSEGLAPPPPPQTQPAVPVGQVHAEVTVPFVFNGSEHGNPPENNPAPSQSTPANAAEMPKQVAETKSDGSADVVTAVRRFFRRLFGKKPAQ